MCLNLFIGYVSSGTYWSDEKNETYVGWSSQCVEYLHYYTLEHHLRSALHLTTDPTDGPAGGYGATVLATYLHHEEGIFIRSAINGENEFTKVFPLPAVNKWADIEVAQKLVDNRFMYSISIGGDMIFEIENQDPKDFFDVSVFASNPWNFAAQNGLISDLQIITY